MLTDAGGIVLYAGKAGIPPSWKGTFFQTTAGEMQLGRPIGAELPAGAPRGMGNCIAENRPIIVAFATTNTSGASHYVADSLYCRGGPIPISPDGSLVRLFGAVTLNAPGKSRHSGRMLFMASSHPCQEKSSKTCLFLRPIFKRGASGLAFHARPEFVQFAATKDGAGLFGRAGQRTRPLICPRTNMGHAGARDGFAAGVVNSSGRTAIGRRYSTLRGC